MSVVLLTQRNEEERVASLGIDDSDGWWPETGSRMLGTALAIAALAASTTAAQITRSFVAHQEQEWVPSLGIDDDAAPCIARPLTLQRLAIAPSDDELPLQATTIVEDDNAWIAIVPALVRVAQPPSDDPEGVQLYNPIDDTSVAPVAPTAPALLLTVAPWMRDQEEWVRSLGVEEDQPPLWAVLPAPLRVPAPWSYDQQEITPPPAVFGLDEDYTTPIAALPPYVLALQPGAQEEEWVPFVAPPPPPPVILVFDGDAVRKPKSSEAPKPPAVHGAGFLTLAPVSLRGSGTVIPKRAKAVPVPAVLGEVSLRLPTVQLVASGAVTVGRTQITDEEADAILLSLLLEDS